MELKDKVVIVTGGARGLGEAICVELAQAGAIPVVADIRLELAETVAQNCREQGGEAIALELDVSNPEQVEAVVDQVISKYGRVNGLVNNAGTDLTVSIEEMPIHEWQRIINVNLNGPFIISKAVFYPDETPGRRSYYQYCLNGGKKSLAQCFCLSCE